MNEEVMIPKSYHDKVCEEIIRFKDKQFYDAVHLLDDGTLEIHVTDYKMVKRVLVEDDNNFGNLFCEDKADRPQGEWIGVEEDWRHQIEFWKCSECDFAVSSMYNYCPNCGSKMRGEHDD